MTTVTPESYARAHAMVWRDRIVRHEAAHAAGYVLAGMIPRRIEAGPYAGRVVSDWQSHSLDRRLAAGLVKAVLAGPLAEGGPAPRWPLFAEISEDERGLVALVRYLDLDRAGYKRMVTAALELMATREFCELEHLFTAALETLPVLTAEQIKRLLGPERLAKYITAEE